MICLAPCFLFKKKNGGTLVICFNGSNPWVVILNSSNQSVDTFEVGPAYQLEGRGPTTGLNTGKITPTSFFQVTL